MYLKNKLKGLLAARSGYATKSSREWLNLVASYCGGFSGKKVLDVGCDMEGSLITEIVRSFGASEAIGINPAIRGRELLPDCRMECGDIRRTSYPDCYFDVIVSTSAFEHIQDLPVALKEMHRVLKTGGILYSHFGPIWSTSYGHHLWIYNQKKLYNYWNTVLPPYSHLLMKPDELLDTVMARGYAAEVAGAVVHYVYNSPEQNRLFYEDYEKIIKNGDFKTLFFKGYDHPELQKLYMNSVSPHVFEVLKDKYEDRGNFMYDGITMLLKKD